MLRLASKQQQQHVCRGCGASQPADHVSPSTSPSKGVQDGSGAPSAPSAPSGAGASKGGLDAAASRVADMDPTSRQIAVNVAAGAAGAAGALAGGAVAMAASSSVSGSAIAGASRVESFVPSCWCPSCLLPNCTRRRVAERLMGVEKTGQPSLTCPFNAPQTPVQMGC